MVAFRWHVRGAGSGIATHFDVATAVRVKEGRVIEWHNRWTRDEALEAAGQFRARRDPFTGKPPACSVEGCETPSRARGMCMKHYMRMHRTGSTAA